MSYNILKGDPDNGSLPFQSLGVIFYDSLKQKDPSKTALIDPNGQKITYGNILRLSCKLANKLKEKIQVGDTISIISDNHWKYLAAILSGFFVGANVMFLNPTSTTREFKHFFEICPPKLVLCCKKSLDTILALSDRLFSKENVVLFSDDSPDFDNLDGWVNGREENADFTPVEFDPKNTNACIFTSSGSTGFPKGVLLTHSNYRIPFLHFGDPDLLQVTEDDSLIAYLPFYHIWGNMVALAGLLYGARVSIISKFQPDGFLTTMQDNQVTKLFIVPQTFNFFAKSPLVGNYDLTSLKEMVVGSGGISPELVDIVKQKLNLTTVRTIYGTTETTSGISLTPKHTEVPGSIGQVTPNNEIKICDIATGKTLGPNETGELRIRGDGLMKEYVNNLEATLKAIDEEGFFKTGDLCYYDKNNFIYIVDRIKDIIRYKSLQIAPAELELLLCQHPSVSEAGVVGLPDEKAGEIPVAFVVKKIGSAVTENELLHYIEKNVSPHKRLHGGIKFVKSLPKTSVGKIWRRRLAELL